MATIDRFVDSVAVLLTGGSTNELHASSLGGVPSSVRVRGLGAKVGGNPPALRIDNVMPANGEGAGSITVVDDGEVTYTPPGEDAGTAVAIPEGETRIIAGTDANQALRVTREADLTLPVGSVLALTFMKILNGVFSMGNVTSAQRVAGRTTYRCVMIKAGDDGIQNLKLWLPAVAGAQAVFSLALEPPNSSGNVQTIANETTAPTGLSWSTPTTEGAALETGALGIDETVGLWIRRVIPAASDVAAYEEMSLAFKYTDGASGSPDFTQIYQQGFRIADDSLALYELYVVENEEPDFESSTQPVATSATLPFSWTPTLPSSGDATFYCVVRQRNKYGLQSFNVFSRKVVFEAGVEVLGPVTAPTDVQAYDGASGYLQVMASYSSLPDLPNPADKWDVYIKIGSDPVIGVDSPAYTGDMTFLDTTAVLTRTFGPYTPGTVAHVLVAAKRSADNARGVAAVVTKTLRVALTLGDTALFGGDTYEQK